MYVYKTALLSLLFVAFASIILILLPLIFHLHASSFSLEEACLTIVVIIVLFLLVDWRTTPHGK